MQGPFVHEQKLHGCRQLTVVPCVQQVATKPGGSVVSPQGTGIAFGCSGCWCCAEVVPSWRRALPHRVTLHPPGGTQRAAGAQGPAEVLLS